MASYCTTCGRGSWACACGLTFRQKMQSLTYSFDGFETRDKKNYYDRESIGELFGDPSEALDATDGLGAGWVENGEHYHVDRKTKQPVRTTDKEMDLIYMGGRTAEDG